LSQSGIAGKRAAPAISCIAILVPYAQTGAGDVPQLVGAAALRSRLDDFRVIFGETATAIEVMRIGPHDGV
jgi:hypothetical protein